MKYSYIFLLISLCPQFLRAQPLQRLRLGDTLPNIRLEEIIQYEKSSLEFADLRGKFLILDFWHRACTSCIEAFPRLEKLQKQFGKELLLLSVAWHEDAETIKSFLKKRRELGQPIAAPIVILGNKNHPLNQLFQTAVFPTTAWINASGKLNAIVGLTEVNEVNISYWMREGQINLPLTNVQEDFDPAKPLLVNNNGGPADFFLYRSLLTPRIDSIPRHAQRMKSDSLTTKIMLPNHGLLELLQKAVGYRLDTVNKRSRFILKDSALIFSPQEYYARQKWQRNYEYCYELIVPAKYSQDEARQFMLEDLSRYFGLKITREINNKPCWVLKKLPGDIPAISKEPARPGPGTVQGGRFRLYRNYIISLVNYLTVYAPNPVIDETGIVDGLTMELPHPLPPGIEQANAALKPYGLVFQEELRGIEVLIVQQR